MPRRPRTLAGIEIPGFSPEEAGLTIVFLAGRWFVTWYDPDQPDSAPIDDSQPLPRSERPAQRPLGLALTPC
jgi:hypothetical protein